MIHASYSGHKSVVQVLVENRADVNLQMPVSVLVGAFCLTQVNGIRRNELLVSKIA